MIKEKRFFLSLCLCLFFTISFQMTKQKLYLPVLQNEAGFIQGYCNKEEGSSPLKQKAGEFQSGSGRISDICVW